VTTIAHDAVFALEDDGMNLESMKFQLQDRQIRRSMQIIERPNSAPTRSPFLGKPAALELFFFRKKLVR